MQLTQIQKVYLSNFLTGLVFWYGIEKLFMKSIGIDAVGIGIASVVFLAFTTIFDIPFGILADKWSRKGVLVLSAIGLATCSVLMGMSHSLLLYAFGEIFYGVYLVSTSGTYDAIIYDILHEEGRADQYSKVVGRMYAIFLVGAGVANMGSGFLAHRYGFRLTFYLTVVSCAINILVILTIVEPKFHKVDQKDHILKQLGSGARMLGNIKLLRLLAIVMSSFAIVDLFCSEFGQLYMLRYTSSVQLLGLLWSVYAFCWALGSFIAHHFRARLDLLVVGSTLPLVFMSFIDNWFSLVLFMVQVVASAALVNQVETRVQENTPSAVRASVMSVLATIGRVVSIPASLIMGWLIKEYDSLWALRFVSIIAALTLVYWLILSRGVPKSNEPIIAH